MGTKLNGYVILQGNIHFRTAQFKHFLNLLARKRLGTRWAKYPFSQCRFKIRRDSRLTFPDAALVARSIRKPRTPKLRTSDSRFPGKLPVGLEIPLFRVRTHVFVFKNLFCFQRASLPFCRMSRVPMRRPYSNRVKNLLESKPQQFQTLNSWIGHTLSPCGLRF